MRLEYRQSIFFVVFAAKTEKHTRVMLTYHELLERLNLRTDVYARRSILPTGSLPKCFIAIQNNDFVARAIEGANLAPLESVPAPYEWTSNP